MILINNLRENGRFIFGIVKKINSSVEYMYGIFTSRTLLLYIPNVLHTV